MALDFAENRQTVGLRFAGVRIPPGARINWAVISFTAVAADAAPVNLRIHGLDADSAPPLRSFGGARTSASALWQPRPWTVGAGTRSSDLRAVVQEVVSRGGWRSGNALSFFVTGDRDAKRSAYAFDKNRAYAPVLSVSYTADGGAPTPPPPSTPSSPSGSCLSRGRGPLVPLSGTYRSTVYVRQKTQGVRVDARTARFLAPAGQASFATNLNAVSFCLSGGLLDVAGLSDTTDWNTFHSAHGLLFYGTPNATVENLTTLEVGDGISFKNDNPNWTFRDSYVRHAGDDGVENDRFNAGTVDDAGDVGPERAVRGGAEAADPGVRRSAAQALPVAEVDRRGGDLHPYLTRTGGGRRHLLDAQHLRPAVPVVDDRLHDRSSRLR